MNKYLNKEERGTEQFMERRKLTTNKIIGIVVLAFLSILGLACIIIGTIQYVGFFVLSPGFIAWMIMFTAIVFYTFVGYKYPHGNLLRCIFLLLSLTCLNGILDSAQMMPYLEGNDINNLLFIIGLDGISVLLIAYVGGRLDKIKKNYFPLTLITVAQLVKSILFIVVYNSFTAFSGWSCFVQIVWNFSTCILWLDIMFAYILRYREHKEAGLEDK